MGMAVNQQQVQEGKTSLRLLLIVLAVVLFVLPVAAVAKLVLATDDELDDVVAQSLLEFTTVRRLTTGGGGNFTHDVVIIKANAEIRIDNMAMGNTLMGYYNTNWDIQLQGDTVWGGRGWRVSAGTNHPIIMRGLRLEVAYTTAGHFSFLRIGTDDFSGILDLMRGATSAGAGSIQRISMDGRIHAEAGITDIWINVNDRRKINHTYSGITIPLQNVGRLYFNTQVGGLYDKGQTDFYISMSDYIYRDGEYGGTLRNAFAINPFNNVHGVGGNANHLPGYGWWMHFNVNAADAVSW